MDTLILTINERITDVRQTQLMNFQLFYELLILLVSLLT